jgi:hypothetical protein
LEAADHGVVHTQPTIAENQLDGLDSKLISSIELFPGIASIVVA